MKRSLCLILLAAIGGFTISNQAGVVLSESFGYPDGYVVGALNSPWVHHDGADGETLIAGGKVMLSSANTEDVSAPLQGAPYATDGPVTHLFASFTLNFSALPSPGGNYFAHFKPATVPYRCRIWAATAGAAPGAFRIGIGNGTATAGQGEIPTDLQLNTDYKIVVRYSIATAESTLWLNPASEGSPGATASDAATTITVTSFAFRQHDGIGTMSIDNLLVGTAFSDVAGPNLPPLISSIADQSIPANSSTGPVPFAIGDDNLPATSLQVSGASDNQDLVPDGNIVLGGAGNFRTITVTPAPDAQGVALISVSVSDGAKQTTTSFRLSVGAPSIQPVPNQITPANTTLGPVTVVVADAEEGPGGLAVSASSSDQQLLPDGNITIGGSGASRTLMLTPAAGETGVATVTVAANDGVHAVERSFVVTVHPVLGVLFADDFDRADGPVTSGAGPWFGHSGNAQETRISGNRLALSQNQTEDINRPLTAEATVFPPEDGPVFFAGFVASFSELPASGGGYFAHFKASSATGFRGRLFATTTGAAAGRLRLGITSEGNAVSAESTHPLELQLDATYTVVLRLNAATGEARLWVNPGAENSGFVDSTDTPVPMAVQSFAFRQTTGMGSLTVDDLKVGTAFAEVVDDLAPVLEYSRSGNDLRLSWPTGGGFLLRRTGILPPGVWEDVPFTTEGDDDVAHIDVSSGDGFLQLEKE